ncbi:MAG: adenylate/guanylate cyclase domain-containing protein [Aphanothece sp. CMT-3BRIN-NPC111]|jgi:adenylate cyclase|nr:adenylate/guanylate cyclase domain-containing protein [Aphanothece sp. CMT-3BRIN-NPC111]
MRTKLKRHLWEWRGVLIAGPSVAVILIALRMTGLLQILEWAAFDQYFRWRPLEPTEPKIVIVSINETDLRKIGKWPLPDTVIAQLLKKIKTQQPRVIGLDLYRDLPVPPGYPELVKVYKSTPNLIGIKKVVGDARGAAVNPPPELSKLGQVAANDLVQDADVKLRRGLLYLTTKDDETVFSLGFMLALNYLEKEGIKPELTENQFVKLGKTVFPPFEGNDGGYVRTDAGGYQILLNFRGAKNNFRTISMTDVLENRIPPELMRHRIVLIGSTAESLKDFFYTPYSSSLLAIRQPTPGVEIQAQVTSQLINSALYGRPVIKTWNEPVEALWIFGWSCIGAVLSWKWRYASGVSKLSPWKTVSIILAGGSLFGSTYLAFLSGWWIPVIPPALAMLGSAIAITGYIAQKAADIRKTFGRYLTDEVVASLLETPEGSKLGGERRKVTTLMSDLRGFSALSEKLPPEKVVFILNIYLEAMVDVIAQYQGTIDEFIGDGILVLFGAPIQREDDAQRAIACAVAMQLKMDAVNKHLHSLNLPQLEMGIGINTGEVLVGNIGSAKRTKYSVIGSHVNLTARIESYTVGGQILISENNLKEAEAFIKIEAQMDVQPKGFNEPITVYEVGGIAGKYNLFLPKEEDTLITLKKEIPVQYTILEGKHLAKTVFKGSLLKLSDKEAEIRAEYLVDPLSNIKINLLTSNYPEELTSDIYAKVVGKQTSSEMSFRIRFTYIPSDVAAVFSKLEQ